MTIFPQELSLGLTEKELFRALAFCADLMPDESIPERTKKASVALATNLNQPDLYYINTLLVSVGWNKNTDVFDKAETWEARNSACDKKFNFEHNEKDIIGHMTGNFCVNEEFDVISDDTNIKDVPDKFHIITNAVIYRHWQDEELMNRINQTIAEIEKGEWFVSMECLFRGFDYALITEAGEEVIIPRNKDTAFLTKYLRAYGGTGTYKGNTVGRMLRNITFSGKGLVRKPANPNSVILLTDVVPFTAASENPEWEKIVMAEATENVKELHATIAELRKRLDEMNEKAVKDKLEEAAAALVAKSNEVAKLNEKLEEASKENKAVAKKLEEATASVASLSAKVKEAEVKERATARIAELVKVGKSQADAEKLVADKYSKLDDEAFATVVTIVAEAMETAKKLAEAEAAVAAAKAAVTTPVKTDENPEDDKNEDAAASTKVEKTGDVDVDVEDVVETAEAAELGKELGALFADILGQKSE